jgi:hypothetical protein
MRRKKHKIYGPDVPATNRDWTIKFGRIDFSARSQRPQEPFFAVIGEKLPFGAINQVKKHLRQRTKTRPIGVYVAHDSMGWPRYIGQGNIFSRLKARHALNRRELYYFSFYLLNDRHREKEIETMLIRVAGPLLHYNVQKKRLDASPGSVRNYAVGTQFYERKSKRK